MNSPTEPGSPTYSTPSTESPPPEEVNYQTSQNTIQLAQLANQITASLSGGGAASLSAVSSSKRRQPHGISNRDRDAKARRREPRHGGGVGGGEPGKKEKDELVDMHIVEKLRKDIGDPFLELES